MALTFAKDRRTVEGDRHVWYGKITFDVSYPTGGEAIAAGDFGLKKVDLVEVGQASRIVEWDKTNAKLKVFEGDYSNAADGPLVEVPNATDLATLAIRAKVIGIGSF